jgi:hypothetical protein
MGTLGEEGVKPAAQAAAQSSSADKSLGDLSTFKVIAVDILRLVKAGDLPGARSRAGDLESAWDKDEPRLKPMNREKWTVVDDAIDDVLRKTRAPNPSAARSTASLKVLIAKIDKVDAQK